MAKLILSDLDMNSVSNINNLPDATSAQQPATLAQVRALIQGLAWKDNARVASTANINLASAPSSVDGVTLTSGERVVAKDQTSGPENGIYVFNGASSAMTRALDADAASELLSAVVTIDEGTANADTTWRMDTIAITLGTTALVWVAFGTAAPAATTSTAGVAALATQSEVNAGTVTNKIVTPATLASWTNAKLKYTNTVGDGSSTSYDITHNLGTRDVHVAVYKTASAYDEVLCDVKHKDTNTITLVFASAPSSGQYSVVIIG